MKLNINGPQVTTRVLNSGWVKHHSMLQAARALDLYDQLGLGAERSEAVIKVTAAIAMTVASGGTTLSIGGAMAVAATGEAALQGNTSDSNSCGREKSTISTADLTTAALEVAIAGGSAGLGAYAKRLASGLAPRVLEKVIGRPATDSEIKVGC